MKKQKFLELLKDPDVDTALGNIMLKAVRQALHRSIKVESGKANPGGPPVIIEQQADILEFIAEYVPHVEGAIRGIQRDVTKTNNFVNRMAGTFANFVIHIDEAIRRTIVQNGETLTIAETSDQKDKIL